MCSEPGATSSDCTHTRGSEYVRRRIEELAALLGGSDVEDASKRLHEFAAGVGLATTLEGIGITAQADLRQMVHDVNLERLRNNPRAVTAKVLQRVAAHVAK